MEGSHLHSKENATQVNNNTHQIDDLQEAFGCCLLLSNVISVVSATNRPQRKP